MPGDPVEMMFAQANNTIPPETLDALRLTFGFVEGPLHEQFLVYLGNVIRCDLGVSI